MKQPSEQIEFISFVESYLPHSHSLRQKPSHTFNWHIFFSSSVMYLSSADFESGSIIKEDVMIIKLPQKFQVNADDFVNLRKLADTWFIKAFICLAFGFFSVETSKLY